MPATPPARRLRFCLISAILLALLTGLAVWQYPRIDALAGIVASRLRAPASIEERLAEHGEAVRLRLAPAFAQAGVAYPPARITLIGLKEEKQLELWAGDSEKPMRLIKTYAVLAASGGAGPKLREGDRQVPEGIYAIESLNPNSRYHLALRVNYPNAADIRRAQAEGRTSPGSDIMIHGKAVSVGCLAIGDRAAEELFVLAALSGIENIRVLLAPCDLRQRAFAPPASAPAWAAEVYSQLAEALAGYRHPQ